MAKPTIQGNALSSGTSITIPSHAVGDLIVVFTYRSGSTTQPTVPAAGSGVPTWTAIKTAAGNTQCGQVYGAIASTTAHTTGTWTNAGWIGVLVIRGAGLSDPTFIGPGCGDPPWAYGAAGGQGSPNSFSQAGGINCSDMTGDSLVCRFHGHRTVTSWSAAPTGTTRVASFQSTGGICINTEDNTALSGIAAINQNTNTSSGWSGFTVEFQRAASAFTADAGPQFDAATVSIRTGTTDPYTFTHTPIGTPKAAIVLIDNTVVGTDEITSVSYGGVGMTEVVQAADAATEPSNTQIWFLGVGVPSGSATVSIDLTSGTDSDYIIVCATYTGSGDMEIVDNDEINGDITSYSTTLQHDGRSAAGVMVQNSGAPSASQWKEKPDNTFFHNVSQNGVDSNQLTRRTHPSATDWVLGTELVSGGADDFSMAAILFAIKATVSHTGAAVFDPVWDTVPVGTATRTAVAPMSMVWDTVPVSLVTKIGRASADTIFDSVVIPRAHLHGAASFDTIFDAPAAAGVGVLRLGAASFDFVFDAATNGIITFNYFGAAQTDFVWDTVTEGTLIEITRGSASLDLVFDAPAVSTLFRTGRAQFDIVFDSPALGTLFPLRRGQASFDTIFDAPAIGVVTPTVRASLDTLFDTLAIGRVTFMDSAAMEIFFDAITKGRVNPLFLNLTEETGLLLTPWTEASTLIAPTLEDVLAVSALPEDPSSLTLVQRTEDGGLLLTPLSEQER